MVQGKRSCISKKSQGTLRCCSHRGPAALCSIHPPFLHSFSQHSSWWLAVQTTQEMQKFIHNSPFCFNRTVISTVMLFLFPSVWIYFPWFPIILINNLGAGPIGCALPRCARRRREGLRTLGFTTLLLYKPQGSGCIWEFGQVIEVIFLMGNWG